MYKIDVIYCLTQIQIINMLTKPKVVCGFVIRVHKRHVGRTVNECDGFFFVLDPYLMRGSLSIIL